MRSADGCTDLYYPLHCRQSSSGWKRRVAKVSIHCPRTSSGQNADKQTRPACSNFGRWGNWPSHRNSLSVSATYRAAGSRIVECDGGLRLFQEARMRCRAPTAKWKSTLGAPHPRNQIRRTDTTVRAVAQDFYPVCRNLEPYSPIMS